MVCAELPISTSSCGEAMSRSSPWSSRKDITSRIPRRWLAMRRRTRICASAHFPLLRIEDASLKSIGGTPGVEWLADLFFVYHQLWLPARHAWDEADGFDTADWDDDLYSQIRGRDDFSYVDFMSARPDRGVPERAMPAPFDPFHEARRVLALRTARTLTSRRPHGLTPPWALRPNGERPSGPRHWLRRGSCGRGRRRNWGRAAVGIRARFSAETRTSVHGSQWI